MTQSDTAALAAVAESRLTLAINGVNLRRMLGEDIAKSILAAGYRLPSSAALERQTLRAEALEEAINSIEAYKRSATLRGDLNDTYTVQACVVACDDIAARLRALAQQNPRESEVDDAPLSVVVARMREIAAQYPPFDMEGFMRDRDEEAPEAVGLDAPAPSRCECEFDRGQCVSECKYHSDRFTSLRRALDVTREANEVALDQITTLTSELAEARAQRDAALLRLVGAEHFLNFALRHTFPDRAKAHGHAAVYSMIANHPFATDTAAVQAAKAGEVG